MKRKAYPIFIFYRHSDTADKAEHLLSLLEAAGYKNRVSFDRENLDGRFDLEILRRLDTCTDFIIILGTETLAHINYEEFEWYSKLATCEIELFTTLEEEFLTDKSMKRKASGEEIREADKHIDFVRLEIARAIAKGKNIIPIVPVNTNEYNFDEIPLPQDIQLLNKYQAVKYQDSKDFLFKDILDRILKRIKTPIPHHLIKVSVIALLLVVVIISIWTSYNQSYTKQPTSVETIDSVCTPVDLGLPSGTLWADRNVGAKSPADFGELYAWGEITPIKDKTKGDNNSSTPTNISGTSYDVAAIELGSNWALPSETQFNELISLCSWEWENIEGHTGYKVTGPNRNAMFLPAAGCMFKDGYKYYNQFGYYWTGNSLGKQDTRAKVLIIGIGEINLENGKKYLGRSVRAVSTYSVRSHINEQNNGNS